MEVAQATELEVERKIDHSSLRKLMLILKLSLLYPLAYSVSCISL